MQSYNSNNLTLQQWQFQDRVYLVLHLVTEKNRG